MRLCLLAIIFWFSFAQSLEPVYAQEGSALAKKEIHLIVNFKDPVRYPPKGEPRSVSTIKTLGEYAENIEVRVVSGARASEILRGLQEVLAPDETISRFYLFSHGNQSETKRVDDEGKQREVFSEIFSFTSQGGDLLKVCGRIRPGGEIECEEIEGLDARDVFQPIHGRFSRGAKAYLDGCYLVESEGVSPDDKANLINKIFGMEEGSLYASETTTNIQAFDMIRESRFLKGLGLVFVLFGNTPTIVALANLDASSIFLRLPMFCSMVIMIPVPSILAVTIGGLLFEQVSRRNRGFRFQLKEGRVIEKKRMRARMFIEKYMLNQESLFYLLKRRKRAPVSECSVLF